MPHWLAQDKWDDFIRGLSEGRELFTHEAEQDQLHLTRAPRWDPEKHELGAFRPVEPLKSLVFPPREKLGPLFKPPVESSPSQRIVAGVKNCDLSALKIHDQVFLNSNPPDPFYAELREHTLLISADCTDCREVCFCTAVGEQPFAREGYDLNLSPLADGWVVESGSARGEAALTSLSNLLSPASPEAMASRDQARQALTERVARQAAEHGLQAGQDFQAAIQKTEGADFWKTFAEDCVECGACNYICCTCHCFLLRDGTVGGQGEPERVKQWDSCLHKNFARVAGGANPRSHRAERLYNRFDKKFNFFPQVLGRYACDGCGRCAEACTGEIDIRDVLKKAVG